MRAVKALEVLDSRGNPTLRACVETEVSKGCGDAPAGASRGKSEALELRDGGERLGGKGVRRAIFIVENIIAPALVGIDVVDQRRVDLAMIALDGTKQKEKLGANSTIAVSVAASRAAAQALGIPLYAHLGGISPRKFPLPLMNLINGGAHAGNELDFQEFLVVPAGADSLADSVWLGAEIYRALRNLVAERFGKQFTSVADEGGFAPPLRDPREALRLLEKAVERVGVSLGSDVFFGIDAAASRLYDESSGVYSVAGRRMSRGELVDYYRELASEFPLRYLEDPLWEEDFAGFAELQRSLEPLGVTVVGDDLYTTNLDRLASGARQRSTRGAIVKPNQIGTVSEAVDFAREARASGMLVVVSHRSGDTEDAFVADLAIALESDFVKFGAPARGERTAKYNRLIEIEAELAGTTRPLRSMAQ
ncbi:MAG: phosphopyruvate hydratase [Fervidicoccaceae archaeon]